MSKSHKNIRRAREINGLEEVYSYQENEHINLWVRDTHQRSKILQSLFSHLYFFNLKI